MQNFNWQFTFKRFIVCFAILMIAKTIIVYFSTHTIQVPSTYATTAFTFAILYAAFSGYMHSKNQNNNQ